MAGNQDIENKLRAGIEAAKQGDGITARRLLTEVVRADGRNELAWIWLATVLPTPDEKRAALQRVLAINPGNTRARDALRRLEVSQMGDEQAGLAARLADARRMDRSTLGGSLADDAAAAQRSAGNLPPAVFLSIGLILLLVVVAVLVLISRGDGLVVPTATPVAELQPILTLTPTPTFTPTLTNTPIPAELITRNAPTLPPTFTFTPPPSETPLPQFTPTAELRRFDLLYVSQDPALPEPDAYIITGDGAGDGLLAEQMRDVAYAPDGFTFAFVRDVRGEGEGEENGAVVSAEVFITTLANPDDVRQVTQTGALDTAHPTWSPDGEQLVFVSSADLDSPALWVVSANGGTPRQLLTTGDRLAEPALSPDGTRLAFVRDVDNSSFTEIFLADIDLEAAELTNIVQATEANGSSYSPAWSPDGLRVAFASDRAGDGDIYLMDGEGFNEQVLTLDGGGAEDRSPAFSPDGLWIAFISNAQDDRFQTYVIDVRTGTDIRRITNNPRSDLSPVFKPSINP